MRPLLLRSAGVVGLAGLIVAAVSNDAFFASGGEMDEPQPAVWQDSSSAEEPVAAVIDPAELRESGQPIVYATDPEVADTPSALETPEAGALEPDRLVFSAEPIVGRLERTVFKAAQAAASAEAAQVAMPAEAAPDAEFAEAMPADESPLDAPVQTASLGSAEVLPPPAPADSSMADLHAAVAARLDAAEEAASTADPAHPGAGATELTAGAPKLWAEEAVACPRDWIAAGSGASGPSSCETVVALLTASEPDDREALEEAAEDYALMLSSIGPRVPRARPEPSPELAEALEKVASTPAPRRRRNADWPDAPPPNCGSLHAYWRFVDRRAGTKEWYCK